MTEWLLLLTLHIGGQSGDIRDVSPQIVSGFSTKPLCDAAAKTVSERFIALVGNARIQEGIAGNSMKSIPKVWYECVSVRK
jgi:hypothetical protein